MEEELAFIDVQGFKRCYNEFIVKEFCLLSGDFLFHDIVQSPCSRNDLMPSYRREVYWLTTMYHGLHFDNGVTSLDELVERTLEHVKGKTIYVKGVEKVLWVKDIYKKHYNVEVKNVEDHYHSYKLTLKNRNEINLICPFHGYFLKHANCHCAYSNAQQLKKKRDYFISQ